eukprot:6212984-Pleurochrysis_carterae.AAC.2
MAQLTTMVNSAVWREVFVYDDGNSARYCTNGRMSPSSVSMDEVTCANHFASSGSALAPVFAGPGATCTSVNDSMRRLATAMRAVASATAATA